MPAVYPPNRKSPARPTTPEAAAGLVAAAASGDRRAALEALRDHLATSVVEATLRDKSALSARLTDVLSQLDSLPLTGAADPVNEIAERARRKRAAATGSGS